MGALFWCLAQHLELSLKDALKNTFFAAIDEPLLQVYYMYECSPKKCHELEVVIEELKACLKPTELPTTGGSRPLRACGTRFVVDKVAALGRLIDRFGAYVHCKSRWVVLTRLWPPQLHLSAFDPPLW